MSLSRRARKGRWSPWSRLAPLAALAGWLWTVTPIHAAWIFQLAIGRSDDRPALLGAGHRQGLAPLPAVWESPPFGPVGYTPLGGSRYYLLEQLPDGRVVLHQAGALPGAAAPIGSVPPGLLPSPPLTGK